MGERFKRKKAKTGNTRMLTMDETNGHAHEKKDSESLNDKTKKEMLTERWATYSVEEQHTIQKEALWRKRWKVCREGLMRERERRAETSENLRSTEQIPSQHKSYPDHRRLNLKWSMCMAAIMVLGGLAMLNSEQYNDTQIVRDQDEELAVFHTIERESTTTNLEPVGKNHTKPLRGWKSSWILKARPTRQESYRKGEIPGCRQKTSG